VFLEANYDVDMLLKGRYPYYLKTRIHGDYGHLSNHQALELFISHRHPDLKYIILSHLSKENNRPEIVSKLFEAHALQTTVVVASRNEESPLFCLSE
jgi:phosphoribosyl 1,2-cyclic phosphodiesterase